MLSLTVSHDMPFTPDVLYGAWTAGWGSWFAESDSVRVRVAEGEPFYFEVEQRFTDGTPAKRHPHYGRFLTLVPRERVSFTWFTGGTGGSPTTVTVSLSPSARGTLVTLVHEGFGSDAARDAHAGAWPHVLAQ